MSPHKPRDCDSQLDLIQASLEAIQNAQALSSVRIREARCTLARTTASARSQLAASRSIVEQLSTEGGGELIEAISSAELVAQQSASAVLAQTREQAATSAQAMERCAAMAVSSGALSLIARRAHIQAANATIKSARQGARGDTTSVIARESARINLEVQELIKVLGHHSGVMKAELDHANTLALAIAEDAEACSTQIHQTFSENEALCREIIETLSALHQRERDRRAQLVASAEAANQELDGMSEFHRRLDEMEALLKTH